MIFYYATGRNLLPQTFSCIGDTNSDTGYRCCRCRLSHPCSSTPPPHRPPPSSPCARSRPLHPYKRKYPPCRDQSSAPPSSSAPIAQPLAPSGASRRIRGRGRHELDGETCAGEWRCGAESSTWRRARERGGNRCHALFLHRSRAATNNTCRVWVFCWRRVLLLQ
jgi:hypothetical protein